MARPEFDLVVIGGGSGGLVVAAGGAALGAKVALVERHKLGGDCLWSGCVPSKTLIKSARIAHQMRHADRWALAPANPQPDLARVMERVARVIAGIEPSDSPARFRGLGVDVILGSGRFVSPEAFAVAGRTLTARNSAPRSRWWKGTSSAVTASGTGACRRRRCSSRRGSRTRCATPTAGRWPPRHPIPISVA